MKVKHEVYVGDLAEGLVVQTYIKVHSADIEVIIEGFYSEENGTRLVEAFPKYTEICSSPEGIARIVKGINAKIDVDRRAMHKGMELANKLKNSLEGGNDE